MYPYFVEKFVLLADGDRYHPLSKPSQFVLLKLDKGRVNEGIRTDSGAPWERLGARQWYSWKDNAAWGL